MGQYSNSQSKVILYLDFHNNNSLFYPLFNQQYFILNTNSTWASIQIVDRKSYYIILYLDSYKDNNIKRQCIANMCIRTSKCVLNWNFGVSLGTMGFMMIGNCHYQTGLQPQIMKSGDEGVYKKYTMMGTVTPKLVSNHTSYLNS